MKEIYILCKDTEREDVNAQIESLRSKMKEGAEITVVTSVSEIPADKRHNLESIITPAQLSEPSAEELIRRFEEMNPHVYEIPTVDRTDYQKLAKIERKEKNMARQKLEKQALKYQNRHYKK